MTGGPGGPDDLVHPSRDDAFVTVMSEAVGGPVGSRARGGRRSFAVAVLLLLTGLTLAVGLAAKSPCVSDQFQDAGTISSRLCGTDLANEYLDTGLLELSWPWSDDPGTRARYAVTEQPALVGLWTWSAARVTHLLAGSPDVGARNDRPVSELVVDPDVLRERTIFVAVNAIGLALLALLVTLAVALTHRRRPWDAAGWALAPVLALAAFTSWDLLAVVCAAAAVWSWTRERPVAAGWLLGLGAAAGVWPALLAAAFAVVGLRTRRLGELAPVVIAGTGVWALANAPAFLSGRSEWKRFWAVAIDRAPDQGTVWAILDDTVGLSQGTASTLSWTALGAWIAVVVALGVLAPRPPRVSQVALLLVAGVVLLRLSYEPQQALWLLPLAVLARPCWRDLLVWQAAEVFHLAMLSWWRGGILDPAGDGPDAFYWLAIVAHVAGTLWLVAAVVRDTWEADLDPVEEGRDLPADRQDTTTRSNVVAV